MPFNTTPDIDFSAIGLITDVPPHSLPPGAWSDCLNIRPKDASVQGVLDFVASDIDLFGRFSIVDVTDEISTNLETATAAMQVVKDRITLAQEEIQAGIDTAQDALSTANENLIEQQELLLDKEEEIEEAQELYDILDSTLYDAWFDADAKYTAADTAHGYLVAAYNAWDAASTAYGNINTDLIYHCTAYNNDGVCTGTETGYKVVRDAVTELLVDAQGDWDAKATLRTSVQNKEVTHRNATTTLENAQTVFDNTDMFDTDNFNSAQDSLQQAQYDYDISLGIVTASSHITNVATLDALDDALELAVANLETAEATYSQQTFNLLQPELNTLTEAEKDLQDIRNIYDSLADANTNEITAKAAFETFEALIKERDDAQEASDKLNTDAEEVQTKQAEYDTAFAADPASQATIDAQIALDVANGDLDNTLEAYTIDATLAEAFEQSRTRLDDAFEALHTSLSSYGTCDIAGHPNKDICEANGGSWSVPDLDYEMIGAFNTAVDNQLTELETIKDNMVEYAELSDFLYQESLLTLAQATDSWETATEEKEAAETANGAATSGESYDLMILKQEAFDVAAEAYWRTKPILPDGTEKHNYIPGGTVDNKYTSVWFKSEAWGENVTTGAALSADTDNTALLATRRAAVASLETEASLIEDEIVIKEEALEVTQDAAYVAGIKKVNQDILNDFDKKQEELNDANEAYQDALLTSNTLSEAADLNILNGRAVAVTQFTPAGSDGLILAYIVKGVDNKGHVIIYDVDSDVWNNVTPATEEHVFTFDGKHKPQIFVFNGCLIVNPATDCPPLWCEASVEAGSLIEMPDWFNDRYKEPGTDEVQLITLSGVPFEGNYPSFLSVTLDGEVKELDLDIFTDDTLENVAVSLANAIGSYAVASNNTVSITFPADYGNVPSIHSDSGDSGLVVSITTTTKGVAPVGTPLVTRILRPFNNRLIAMDIKEERDPSITEDDEFLPIDFLWSGNIKTQGTLVGLEWAISSINTAGDSFLTQTPGKIVDGMQLGPYFMVYKDDAVIQASETGNAFVLNFRSVFEDDGLYSSGCTAPIGNNQHLVVGNYGVYIHDGQTQKQHIAKGIFQDFLFKAVDPAHKDRSFVFQQTRDKEIWFCFSSVGNTGTGCNGAFVYDYEAQKLHRRTLPDVTDLYETELDGKMEIYGATSTGLQILDPESYVSGGWFERKNESLQSNNFKTVTGCNIKSEGAVDVYSASNKNINDLEVYTSTPFDPAEDYKVNFRQNGRYLSIKIEMVDDSNQVAINPKLTTISFDMKETSRR